MIGAYVNALAFLASSDNGPFILAIARLGKKKINAPSGGLI
jgi:hypothetical protein